MPLPHNHPSLHCFKTHRCRCDGCRDIHRAWRSKNQARRRAAIRNGTWMPAIERTRRVLDQDELARLRRAIGLDPSDVGPA